MKSINAIAIICLTFLSLSCGTNNQDLNFNVTNELNFSRQEVVEIGLDRLITNSENAEKYPIVIDSKTGNQIPYQTFDNTGDGIADLLLVYVEIGAKETKSYSVSFSETKPEMNSKVFSRFVPERTDDFAWENDRVAFRTYGPTAQKMIEDGTPGGTLSSGMDCWLKKVDYPIIDKWYKKHTSGEGSYHEDTGEGLDNFHVGASRGCGGLGVFVNDELFTSKNFTSWEIHANGPIRTSFSLDYEDWKADKISIKEEKKISLDLGSNLMKVEAKISGSDVITVGLTLHENDGKVSMDTAKGWFSYWQPHGESELGTAIVCNPEHVVGFTHLETEEKDKSHLLVHLKVIEGSAVYYTGFSWKESEQFTSKTEWEQYLNNYAKALKMPLEIEIN